MLHSLIRITNKKVLLPLYHCINDEPPSHLVNLYKVRNVSEFESDIDFILKKFKPIDVDILNTKIKNKEKFNKNSVLFTFDDGLREIKEIVLPIFIKKGVPAIVFVNTKFVDNKDLFYRYKASILVENLKNSSQAKLKEISKSLNINEINLDLIREAILTVNYQNKNKLDQIAAILNFSFDTYLKNEKPYLSLEELKEIQSKGFQIGAHSIDHPEYFNLQIHKQLEQTFESIKWVKDNLNPKHNLFAFPFTDYGVSKQFFDRIYNDQNLNLDLSFGCAGIKDDYHPYHLQRLPIEEYKQSASNIITKEYFAYLLKKMIRKNRIVRK